MRLVGRELGQELSGLGGGGCSVAVRRYSCEHGLKRALELRRLRLDLAEAGERGAAVELLQLRSVGLELAVERAQLGGDPATATLDIAESKQSARDAALTALGQIGGANAASLQKIKDDVNAAVAETTDAGAIWSRLRALVDDIGTLERSKWTNTAPAWTAVARLVTYVEYEYYLAGGK